MVSLPDLPTIHRLSAFGKSYIKAPRAARISAPCARQLPVSGSAPFPRCSAARIVLCLPAAPPLSRGITPGISTSARRQPFPRPRAASPPCPRRGPACAVSVSCVPSPPVPLREKRQDLGPAFFLGRFGIWERKRKKSREIAYLVTSDGMRRHPSFVIFTISRKYPLVKLKLFT